MTKSERLLAILVAILVVAVPATGIARAPKYWYGDQDHKHGWIHRHNLDYSNSIQFDDATTRNAAGAARREWNDALDPALDSRGWSLRAEGRKSDRTMVITDMDYHGQRYGKAISGWHASFQSQVFIDAGQLRQDTEDAGVPGLYSREVQATVCQEMGHIFGLAHGGDDCMESGYFNHENFPTPALPGSRNIEFLIARYKRDHDDYEDR